MAKKKEEPRFVVYAKQSDFHTFQPPKKLGKWILVVCGLLLGFIGIDFDSPRVLFFAGVSAKLGTTL